ncbi:MAG TPA: hypothetical protein VHA09_07665 [Nitrososphaera sp.]|nr:hypothetical protein [Nitrososphaera sp.]
MNSFRQTYISGSIWNFAPFGNNLVFELSFMKHKLKQYFGCEGLMLGHRSIIALKHVLIIVNNGSFKGYQHLLGKAGRVRVMTTWYYNGSYQAILDYVNFEGREFLKMYLVPKTVLPRMITI